MIPRPYVEIHSVHYVAARWSLLQALNKMAPTMKWGASMSNAESSSSAMARLKSVRYLWLIRDLVIFYILVVIGGIAIAVSGIDIGDPSVRPWRSFAKIASTILVGTLGALTAKEEDRVPYLRQLSLAMWGIGLVEGLFMGLNFVAWFISYIPIVLSLTASRYLALGISKLSAAVRSSL